MSKRQIGVCRIGHDGNVSFCEAMKKYCQTVNDSAKGLVALGLANLAVGKIRVAGVIYKERPSSSGILLNFCPWCGQEIEAIRKGGE